MIDVWEYKGEMTWKEAVKKYGKQLPDLTELKAIPKEILMKTKDRDCWGIILDKQGKICGPVARWLVSSDGRDLIYLVYYPIDVREVIIKKVR